MGRPRSWTDAEDDVIRELYPAGGWKAVVDVIGKTKWAVMSEASRIGVKCERRENAGTFRPGHVPPHKGKRMSVRGRANTLSGGRSGQHLWTDEDDAFIREHYHKRSCRWIARHVGVSVNAVKGHAQYIGASDPDAATGGGGSLRGYRADIGHSVRSTWEANYARVLNHLDIPYKYEPSRNIKDGDVVRRYHPDFYVHAQSPQYVEIKGDGFPSRDESVRRFGLFRRQNPDEQCTLVTPEHYRLLERRFKNEIPMWETQNFNVKTHPEVFGVTSG